MEIKISHFCGLSRNQDWHDFLQRVAPDLQSDLLSFLKKGSGCRSARSKMLEIYKRLYEIGKGAEFEDLMRRRFPYMVESKQLSTTTPTITKPQEAKPLNPKPVTRPTQREPKTDPFKEIITKHGVFKSYKPEILTFPHKLILINSNPSTLLKMVKEFLADKITIDYVVINDVAYIEYLLTKYNDMVDKITLSAREIAQYRIRKSQNDNTIK